MKRKALCQKIAATVVTKVTLLVQYPNQRWNVLMSSRSAEFVASLLMV